MSFQTKEYSDYKLIPESTHKAVSSALVDLGLQDVFGTDKPQLLIRFEFPGVRDSREKNGEQVSGPMVKWQFYTNSLHKESNLRRDLENWRGKGFTKEELGGFDVRQVIGHACQISIIHDHSGDRTRDKVSTIGKFMGDGAKPLPELEVICYSKEEGEIGQWDLLPEWIQEKISQQKAANSTPHKEDPFKDDDIKF
jgi:hypothetical protein